MTRYADIPKSIRSGIVVVDPDRGAPQRVIVLQFNPDTLERSIAPQSAGNSGDSGGGGSGGGDRNEALRLKGPAEETWKFTAEIDATDQLEIAAPDGFTLNSPPSKCSCRRPPLSSVQRAGSRKRAAGPNVSKISQVRAMRSSATSAMKSTSTHLLVQSG